MSWKRDNDIQQATWRLGEQLVRISEYDDEEINGAYEVWVGEVKMGDWFSVGIYEKYREAVKGAYDFMHDYPRGYFVKEPQTVKEVVCFT